MKPLKLFLLAALISMGTIYTTQAQSQKQNSPEASSIAHISVQKLIKAMPEYQSAMSQLKKLEKSYRSEIKALLKEAEKKNKKYKKMQSTSTQQQNVKRAKEMRSMQQKIMQYRKNAQKQLRKKENKLIQPIIKRAKKAIEKVANRMGFDYVFNSAKGASNIIMANGYNLLPDVKEELGI